ncbi:transposase [Streptomyces sp. NBC_00059]|uniref:transposase n=1 Tax=Streptomyces sp. NBC_00059 TaxID=2975635 RepID=UPI00225B4071|nr:transposase [Streptomyces sp. NBC_00059]MCX5415760.1 transposase [Streptomyces sp. NBC_00059]
MGRGDLTDEQWAVLEPLLPKGRRAGRPPVWPRRQLIDGIRFRVRTGVPWRDVPVEYGPWGRVYDLFPVATRYDKLAVRYEATVLVAVLNEWL